MFCTSFFFLCLINLVFLGSFFLLKTMFLFSSDSSWTPHIIKEGLQLWNSLSLLSVEMTGMHYYNHYNCILNLYFEPSVAVYTCNCCTWAGGGREMIILSYRVSSKPARTFWNQVSNTQTTKKLCFCNRICVSRGEIHSMCACHFIPLHFIKVTMAPPKHRIPVDLPHIGVRWSLKWVQDKRSQSKVTQKNVWLSTEGPELALKTEKREQWHFKKYLWLHTLMACHYTGNNDTERKRKIKQAIICVWSFLICN